jgi:hypothetical protein
VTTFQKGQILYVAAVAEFEGREYPAVMPARIAAVAPQREGGIAYHVRVWRLHDQAGHTFYNLPASVLHTDPVAALYFAMEALAAPKQEGMAHG